MPSDELETLLRDHGDLEGLARGLGQFGSTFIADEDDANDNVARGRVGLWRRLFNRLRMASNG